MKPVGTRTLAAVVLSAVVAACGAASTSTTPAPAVVAPGPISVPATSVPPASPAAPRSPAAEPSGEASPATIVLDGTWVRPKAGARLTSYTTTLSATPIASGPGATTFTKVVFSATWAGAGKTRMCTATKPGPKGVWACKANLLALGVPPGRVTFSFDVHGEGVAAARSPDGPRKVTYAVRPPRPTGVSWKQTAYDDEDGTYVYRVAWSAPDGYADEFLVYETFECPRPATEKSNGKPCFVAGTPVDSAELELLAKVPGDVRAAKVRPTAECFPSTILLRARNAYGKSVFAIVDSAPVIWIDPNSNDTIC